MGSRQEDQATPSRNATSSATESILHTQTIQRNCLLDEYFESTQLLQVIQNFSTGLATTFKTELRLPANPYPELLNTVRMHELRQDFVLQGNDCSGALELTLLGDQTSIPQQFQVFSVDHEQFAMPIWGCKFTLEQCTGANLYGLLALLSNSLRGLMTFKEFTDDECQATAYGALVGNSIFGARLQDLPPCFLEFETHVFVAGLHLEKTMAVFVRFLIKQLREASNAATTFASLSAEEATTYRGCVLCDGISISPQTSSCSEIFTQDVVPSVWTIERVLESRVAFMNAVKTALVSNSLITINRYESTQLSNLNGGFLCHVEQAFFFHFSMLEGSKSAYSTKNVTSWKSFFIHSSALTSGIFFDSQGALRIAARFRAVALEEERKNHSQKKKQVAVSKPERVAEKLSGGKSQYGFVGILQELMNNFRHIGLGNEEFRQQMNRLVNCFAYSLGYLVAAHEMLENIFHRPECSASMVVAIQASFTGLEILMKKCIEEASASLQTSLLHSTCSLLSHFYSQLQAASVLENEQHVGEFMESLRCVKEFLFIVIRVAFNDFLDLVGSSSTNNRLREDPAFLPEIDVLRSLEVAIEERKYPAAIVSEAVFAQFVVDSCLDVALESAVMNTIAVGLSPNPFIEMTKNLQVFAVRQLVWNQAVKPTPCNNISTVIRPGLLDVFLLNGTNVCAVNPKLLQLISGDKIIQTYQWLMDHHLLHDGNYKPSKSSYSAAIFPMILVFHPLFIASARNSEDLSLFNEIDVMEHYILEGKDQAQALSFFIEAACTDLQKISSLCGTSPSSTGTNCWQLQVEAHVIDSRGQIVAVLGLSSLTPNELLVATLEEATRKRLGVQVVIHIAEVPNQGSTGTTPIVIHKVTKQYVFHHRSTDHHEAVQSSTLMSPLMSFRVSEYGVFLSKENIMLCLQIIESDVQLRQHSDISREEWTPYASLALQRQDSLLIYELNIVHESVNHSSSQHHRENELFNRLVTSSNICQLYSLEQSVKWLLDAHQCKLQQRKLLKSRTDIASTGFPPSTVFSVQNRLTLQIIAQVEQLVIPLNHQLQFVHQPSNTLATLRKCVARWHSTQPPTDEQIELYRKEQNMSGIVFPTPRDDSADIIVELVDSLRAMWVLLLFFRFSYQRAFFAHADSKSESGQGETTSQSQK